MARFRGARLLPLLLVDSLASSSTSLLRLLVVSVYGDDELEVRSTPYFLLVCCGVVLVLVLVIRGPLGRWHKVFAFEILWLDLLAEALQPAHGTNGSLQYGVTADDIRERVAEVHEGDEAGAGEGRVSPHLRGQRDHHDGKDGDHGLESNPQPSLDHG